MNTLNSLPINVQDQVKDTLKAYDHVNVWFSNGEYHVSSGCFIAAVYASDDKFIGTFNAKDIYTDNERIINYVESFHDYPIEYKGKRDYKLLDSIGNDYSVKFTFDENGNIIIKKEKEGVNMKITVNLKPGMMFARGNDFIELIAINGDTSFIVHVYDINKQYTGAMYMTVNEIEKWINKNGFEID